MMHLLNTALFKAVKHFQVKVFIALFKEKHFILEKRFISVICELSVV